MTEIDKLRAVQPDSQIIGRFLDWLADNNIELCLREKAADGLWRTPISASNIEILAQYFDIDLQKLDDEKRAILDNL